MESWGTADQLYLNLYLNKIYFSVNRTIHVFNFGGTILINMSLYRFFEYLINKLEK
jgi:hypothetical protein